MRQVIFAALYYGFHLMIWGGTAHIVFWRDESGWWFLMAFLISALFSSVKIK